jgi:hypothetical protein
MLMLADTAARFDGEEQTERLRRQARLIVPLPDAPQQRADYTIVITVRIMCGNKQDLMSFHWPKFLASQWPEGIDHVDVDAKTHAGKPNLIHVRKILRNVREHEAVAYCLSLSRSLMYKLDRSDEFRFIGERLPSLPYSDGISGFVMSQARG